MLDDSTHCIHLNAYYNNINEKRNTSHYVIILYYTYGTQLVKYGWCCRKPNGPEKI
jgi:hypothetical protein